MTNVALEIQFQSLHETLHMKSENTTSLSSLYFPTKNNKRTTKANINKFDTLRDLSDSGDSDDSENNNIQNWVKHEDNRPLEDLKVYFIINDAGHCQLLCNCDIIEMTTNGPRIIVCEEVGEVLE
ncbi:12720_t:CDS:2, partial [Gigaspora rosea]